VNVDGLGAKMAQSNKDNLRRFFEQVWDQGDETAVDAFLADSYTIQHDPGDPWHGKTLDINGFKERLRVSRTPFPDQKFNIQEMTEEDNRIAVSWLWTGTHKADIPGFPASGKVISMSGLTIYFFKEGRICGHWQQTDRLSVFQQLSQP